MIEETAIVDIVLANKLRKSNFSLFQKILS